MTDAKAKERYGQYIGHRFGILTVTDVVGSVIGKHPTQFICKCDCGRTVAIEACNVKSGNVSSCGQCGYREKKIREANSVDMTGFRSGNLVALYSTGSSENGSCMWHCRCDCGNELDVAQDTLKWGDKKSCGKCDYANRARREALQIYKSDIERKLAKVFDGMVQRCYNPKCPIFERYGGRGITIDPKWRENIKEFVDWSIDHGYKPGLTIERNDNNKGYSPENCSFETKAIQNRNKRNNVNVTIGSTTMVAADWAAKIGVDPHLVQSRIRKYGMDVGREYIVKKLLEKGHHVL